MEAVWDGITLAGTLVERAARAREALADAARAGDWPRVFAVLADWPDLVNSPRLGGASGFAPLHHAARAGAPPEVVERLVAAGAWRMLRNAHGERAVDVASRRGHRASLAVLTPAPVRAVPDAVLSALQRGFHEVVRGRAGAIVAEHRLRLPELEPLLELHEPRMWFPVPRMYGGFRFWLERAGEAAMLVSESWSRVADGSRRRHEITASGTRRSDAGPA